MQEKERHEAVRLSDDISSFDTHSTFNDCLESEGVPRDIFVVPVKQLPPRKKAVWIWACCVCGNGGMKVSVDPCPYCGTPRCPNCDTRRANAR
ncbi:hypothetical protein BKA59DRAFT_467397 [Fusarium tricinctum]|uniref:Uncharacterized protein n=1 Tax=Fusarium tricinctum TaxID=61284 RepID=A0A8K0WF64_9HYPO|nr:hypothetical protein BKA59DRAFT_467397 [Fusarium tricinctum]